MARGLFAWLLITPNDAGSCMLSVGSLNTTWLKAFKKSAEKRKATLSVTGVRFAKETSQFQ